MKKIITLFLSILIAFSGSLISQNVFADTEEFYNHDVIVGLGFMDVYPSTGNFEDANRVSRAEFAKILCKFANVPAETGNADFRDVDENTLNQEYIYTAVKYHLMNGVGNGEFHPNDFVTLHQAVKPLMVLLGYEDRAMLNGGYPLGYYTCAADTRVIAGVQASEEGYISRKNLATLLYNTMHTNISEVTVFNTNGSISYTKGQEMLQAYHGILEGEGILTANERTALDSVSSNIGKGMVRINDVEYFCGNTDASELLGQNVRYYYTERESGVYELVCVLTKDNARYEIATENLIPGKSSFQNIYFYNERGEEDYYELETNLKVIYNGVYFYECTLSDLFPAYGDVTYLDNDGDGIMEVAFVNQYDLMYVSHTSVSAGMIIDKSGKDNLNLEDYKYLSFRKDNGDIITDASAIIEAISPNDVLLLAYSKASNVYLKILASSTAVRETLQSMNSEGEYQSKKKTYRINPLAASIASKLELGTEYTLRLDAFGNIAELAFNEKNYAYLIDVIYPEDLLEPEMYLKLYTTSGIFEKFQCSEKMNIRVGGVIDRYEISEAYPLFIDKNKKVVNQLIAYQLSGEDLITDVELPNVDIGSSGADGMTLNYESAEAGKSFDGVIIGSEDVIPGVGSAMYSVEDAVMFTVPESTKAEDIGNENLYQYTNNTKSLELGQKYNIKCYDADENNNCKVVVRSAAAISTDFNNDEYVLFVIEGIGEILNSKGEAVKVVRGYHGGKKVSYMLTEEQEAEISQLHKGDALFVSLRSDNYIAGYAIAVRDTKAQDILDTYYSSNKTNGAAAGKSFANQVFLGFSYYIMSGVADRVTANGASKYDIYLTAQDINNITDVASADLSRRWIVDSKETVVYCDTATGKLWLGNYNEIEPGDKVCIAGMRKYYVSCVVYK